MQPRLDSRKVAPAALHAMLALEEYVRKSSRLEPALLELIRMRASQINGCAYCLDMHSKDARAHGETEQRLHTLSAWRETPFFTDRERAALAWTEAVTEVSRDHVPDSVYEEARQRFSEEELVHLTLAVTTINCLESLRDQLPRRSWNLPAPSAPGTLVTGRNEEFPACRVSA